MPKAATTVVLMLESPEAVAHRLQAARDELAAAEEFDCVIVNADVGECARSLLALVADPTSVPRGRVPDPDDPIDE